MYRIVITLLLSAASVAAVAQDTLRVQVRAYAAEEGIRLRWAVNSAQGWLESNRNGFRVERYTVVRDGKMLATPERKLLTAVPLKAQPLNNWQTLATADGYAAIIAQALYGEHFSLSGDDGKGISKLMALAQESEQRYMVSLYAADRSYPAALMAGWGLRDTTALANERYLYRVTPERGGRLPVKAGAAYISLADHEKLPKPQELTGKFGDKSVMLTWNYSILKDIYNAYYIEKSTDGKSFQRISNTPVTNINGRDGKPNDRIYYMDTLASNATRLHYRVVGLTAFGESGPPSDTVHGEGKTRLVYVPHVRQAMVNPTGNLDITWEFDERGNAQIKSFELQRGDNSTGPFTAVIKDIQPSAREAHYNKLQRSNYFVITAIPINGEPIASFPVLVQPADTVPPAVPMGLIGTVDTLGIVRLSWQPNTESDILGYRLYRAQTAGEELVPITDVAIIGTSYSDTVNVRNLNGTVYYALTALDRRYNQSDKSPVATLRKPELVPPSTPIITNYQAKGNAIVLDWVTGGEENLAALRLYRQERGGKKELLKEIRDKQVVQFADSTVKADRFYQYSLAGVTTTGLASAPSPVVTVQASSKPATATAITGFTASYSNRNKRMQLTWKHDPAGVKQLEIYKAEAGQAITLWKVLKAFEESVQDVDVAADKKYDYMIRVVLSSGKHGGVAKTTSR